MYNFIFWVLYMGNLKDGRSYGKFNGVLIVTVTFVLHVFLVLAVLKKIFARQFEQSGIRDLFNDNKSTFIIFIILMGVVISRYYNKNRIERILNRYSGESQPTKTINVIKVVALIIIPIVLGAIILSI